MGEGILPYHVMWWVWLRHLPGWCIPSMEVTGNWMLCMLHAWYKYCIPKKDCLIIVILWQDFAWPIIGICCYYSYNQPSNLLSKPVWLWMHHPQSLKFDVQWVHWNDIQYLVWHFVPCNEISLPHWKRQEFFSWSLLSQDCTSTYISASLSMTKNT